uniref:Uncharacterized protein n=1 Tax=Anopheles farauti TaxID=69004 RepID=A0A182QJB2_9DIPT
MSNSEYLLVRDCQLNDLLNVEKNPMVLERICEGEKLQTAEFYTRQEKLFDLSVVKIYRKDRVNPPQPRIIRPALVSGTSDNATIVTVPPSMAVSNNELNIPAEGAFEPIRSNEDNAAAKADPYQMREETETIAFVMPSAINAITEDDNFGSKDMDGARDFLELCTGVELPPMTGRQTLTQEMLLSQFPSMNPIADNFQEMNVKDIGTPIFRRPLWTSTPFVKGALEAEGQLSEVVPQELPTLDTPDPVTDAVPEKSVPETRMPGASVEKTLVSNNAPTASVPVPVGESSSSAEGTDPPRPPARPHRQVGFTERLVPLDSSIRLPRARQSFDIFSLPHHECWNQMIQEVQTILLQERERAQPLVEDLIMREAVPEPKDSGYQQTMDEKFTNPQFEQSNSRIAQIEQSKERSCDINHQSALTIPDLAMSSNTNQLDQLPSLDKNFTEVSNPYKFPKSIDMERSKHLQPTTNNNKPNAKSPWCNRLIAKK